MEILLLKDMKTNVVMKRPMGQFEVLQRTIDGYFDGNALLNMWKSEHPTYKDTVNEFLGQKKVQMFITELEEEFGDFAQPRKWVLAETQGFKSIKYIKGKNTAHGRSKDQVWMHPYMFIKFAMWINPKFELQVIKFVYDELIKNRHLAGDNYNVLTAALATMPDIDYKKVATAIQWIVFNRTGKNLRQQATQEQLSEISDIESKLAYAINMGFIKSYDELIITMRKMYNDKYQKF